MSGERGSESREQDQGAGIRDQGVGSGGQRAVNSEQGSVGVNCNSPFNFRGNSNSSLKE